jgi:hypothetical protein
MKITDVMNADAATDQAAGQVPDEAADQGKGQNPDMAQDEEQATPEEQQAYDQVVMAGAKMLYDEKTHQSIMELLQGAKNTPARAIASAVMLVIQKLKDASKDSIPAPVVLPAAAEIAQLVAELAQKAGFFKVSDAVMQSAGQIFIPQVAELYGVNEEELQALSAKYSDEQKQQMSDQQLQAGKEGGAPVPPEAAPSGVAA